MSNVSPFSFFSSVCHSSCASCWGPSVSQCTLCSVRLLLHQGQCVEACGEGLYSQDKTCHSKAYISFVYIYLSKCESPFLIFYLPNFKIVIPLAGPVWDPWPQTVFAVSNRRKPSCHSPVTSSMASAQLDVQRAASWIICRHAEVSGKGSFFFV